MDDLRDGEARRGAVHEAGHTIVALGLGVTVEKFIKVEGNDVPAALRAQGCDRGTATDFCGIQSIEPRKQLLVALAGVAAEELVLGKYSEGGAAQDFGSIAHINLNPEERRAVIEIGQSILRANQSLLEDFSKRLEPWLDSKGSSDLAGDIFNQEFTAKGSTIDVSAELDARLPE